MLMETLATGGAMGATGGIFGYLNNERNIDMQRETNAANYQLWKENIYQEDHAIQRRKADMLAAGFSPVLAAGQGASTPSPIKMDAPKSDDWMGAAASQGLQGLLAASQVSKTNMDNQRTAAEIGKIGAETINTMTNTSATDQNMEQQLIMNAFQSKAISASTFRDMMEASRKKYELERDQRSGVGEKSTAMTRQVQDAVEGTLKKAEQYQNDVKRGKQKNPKARFAWETMQGG